MTAMLDPVEGEAEFDVPAAGKPCKTYYRIYGNLESSIPLILLHGGPGIPSNYLAPIIDVNIASGIPVILYDQIGNGNSTRLPEKMGDVSFWTVHLFIDELKNLMSHLGINAYNLLGHSWGGMLGATFAIQQPKGLRKLILSDVPASTTLWVKAADKLRAQLPTEVQDVLNKNERHGTTDSEEYQSAVGLYYSKHLCRLDPMPDEISYCFQSMKEDPTVGLTMNGPSEFYVTGSLRDWTIEETLHKIEVPTLLLNGRYDEAQDEVMEPYFQKLKKVKWVRFGGSSHMPFWEERDEYMRTLGLFLTQT